MLRLACALIAITSVLTAGCLARWSSIYQQNDLPDNKAVIVTMYQ